MLLASSVANLLLVILMDVSKPTVPVNPEEEELAKKRQELVELESDLTEQELHLTGLRLALAVFERRYLRIVGTLYAELDDVEAQIAEILARSRPSDLDAQGSAEQARTRANDSRAALQSPAESR